MSYYNSVYPRTTYYYAYLNADGICTEIVQVSTPISDANYIQIPSNNQSLIGQYFDRSSREFKTVYYYAVLNEKDVVIETDYSLTARAETEKFRRITYAQYLTVKGLWWDGTDYVQPPISVQAVVSTDQINYGSENVWLTTVLETMKDKTAENTAGIERNNVQIQLAKDRMDGIASVVSTVSDRVSAVENDLDGTKADIESSFNAVTGDIQAIGGDIESIETEIRRIDTNIDALVHTANDHEGAINQLEALAEAVDDKIQRMDAQVDTLTESANDHAARIASLESDMSAAGYDISMNKQRIDALESETDERFEAYGTQMNGLESSVRTAQSDITALKSRTTAVENRATALETKATTLERDVTTAKSNITSLTTQVNANKTQAAANKTKIAALETAQQGYLPLTGGVLNGDLNVKGVLRMEGSQAFYYNVDAQTMNIGTNNAKTVNFGGVHSGGVSYFNSALLRPYSVVPRNSESLLGNSTYRWKGIYSQAAVNVSSDERLKKNIEAMSVEELAQFVHNLAVVSYQYKDEEMPLDRIGLIAQQVIYANPELARYFVSCEGDGFYSLRPADLVYPLIAAVQQLQDQVKKAHDEIVALKEKE